MFFNKKTQEDKNPDVLVFVKQEPVDVFYKRKIEVSSDGTKNWIVIDPQTEKKAGWKLDVTGCLRPSTNGLYCEAIRGASKAIKFDLENKEYTLSKLTNDEAQQIINLKIFKAHYGQLLKDLLQAIKPILIIFAIVVVISVCISGYNAYVLSKIPYIAVPIGK